MKAREFFLLILLIAAGVFLTHIYSGRLGWHLDWDEGFLFSWDEFSFEETREFSAPLPAEISVENINGDVTVVGGKDERLTIELTKHIWRNTESDAAERAGLINIFTETEDGLLKISVNRHQLQERGFHTDFRITLPEGTPVSVNNTYGSVAVYGTGTTVITNNNGKVMAADIRGECRLLNRNGAIEAQDIEGRCSIDGRDGPVRLSHIEGPVDITHGYGRIELENIRQDVKIGGNDSRIIGHVLPGGVNIENDHGPIELHEIGSAAIDTSHGLVEIDGLQGRLDIKNRFSKVKLNQIRGDISITGKDLEVSGEHLRGTIGIATSYRNVDLSDFAGKTTISSTNSKVLLSPAPLSHPIEVDSTNSDIKLYWPGKGKYPLEARSEGGDIQWDMPYEVDYRKENGLSHIKAFTSGNQHPGIRLHTTYGTIRIEE